MSLCHYCSRAGRGEMSMNPSADIFSSTQPR